MTDLSVISDAQSLFANQPTAPTGYLSRRLRADPTENIFPAFGFKTQTALSLSPLY